MFESVSWLGMTLASFWAAVAFFASIMLAVDIYREWKFCRVERREKVGYEPKIGDDYDPRKDVYDWKKEAPNDFS